MSQVDLICCICNKKFSIRKADYNNNIKRFGFTDEDFSCGRSCGAKRRNQKVKSVWSPQYGNKHGYKGKWTAHINKARNRTIKRFNEGLDNLVDDNYLEELWSKQNGMCAITGKQMMLKYGNSSPYNVSLDRICNDKPYIKGNIQLVCYSANLARSTFSIDEIKEFFLGSTQDLQTD